MTLPRGIWYEAKHNRYRVRLYRANRVEHLSYHKNKEDAIKTYALLKTPTDNNLLARLIAQAHLYYKGARS